MPKPRIARPMRSCVSCWKYLDRNSGLAVLVLAGVTFLSAFVGTLILEPEKPTVATNGLMRLINRITDAFYEAGQALILNMESHVDDANLFIAVSRVTAVLLVTFVATKTIGKLFKESTTGLRLRFGAKRSAFIGGLGRIGYKLTIDYLKAGQAVVVQEFSGSNHLTRLAEDEGAIVVEGDVADIDSLREYILRDPAIIHLVTGNDMVNINALANVRAIRQENPQLSPATCYVHIDDPGLQRTLHRCVIENACAVDDSLTVHVFNIFHETAVQLIIDKLTPLRPRTNQVALYIVFGFGKMGQAMVKELAEYAHFENQKRSRILVLTDDAPGACRHALSQWGQLSPRFVHETVGDVRFVDACDHWNDQSYRPIDENPAPDPKAVEYAANVHFCELPDNTDLSGRDVDALVTLAAASGVRPIILFCNDDDDLNFKVASEFNDRLQDIHGINVSLGPHGTVESAEDMKVRTRHQDFHLPIFVFLPQSQPLREILSASNEKYPIIPFGDVAEGLERAHDDLVELVAMDIACAYDKQKELKSAKAAATASSVASMHAAVATTAPHSALAHRPDYIREWRKKSFWDRQSNLAAAEHAWIKLQMIGYRMTRPADIDGGQPLSVIDFDSIPIEDKSLLALVEHNRWMAERLLQGWSYGEHCLQPPRRESLCAKNVIDGDELLKDYEQIKAVFQHLQRRGLRVVPCERIH